MCRTLIVITKGSDKKQAVNNLYTGGDIIDCFEIAEEVDITGKVVRELKESEINPLLRKLFKLQPYVIRIQLTNSAYNPIHAINLYNIIKASPYKGEITIENLRAKY